MNASRIALMDAVMQEVRPYYNGNPQKDNGDVLCPMCDLFHENSTWCQMTMEGQS